MDTDNDVVKVGGKVEGAKGRGWGTSIIVSTVRKKESTQQNGLDQQAPERL